jgi:hypothetical protein
VTQTGNLTHDTRNEPPPEKPKTLEQQVRERHADFLKASQAWIDSAGRAPEVIPDDATNEKIGKTVQELIKARTKAETHHKAEKAPFLESGRVIDGIFLTGVSKAAQAAQTILENRQRVFLRKKQAEETARLAAEAEKLRLEQEAAKQASEDALRAAEKAQDRGDFEAADKALETAAAHEEAAQQAQTTAEAAETKAEGPVQDMLRVHSSLGVTISGKTEWVTTLADRAKIDWSVLEPFLSDADILKAAKAAVKAGRRSIAGFTIESDIKPINR